MGRIISIIGRPEAATPYFSARVTSWDSSTGTIGVTPDPNGILEEGDCFVLRFNADASNTASPTSITDSGCQNNVYPNGMTPGAEVGNLVRVIQGVSRGLPASEDHREHGDHHHLGRPHGHQSRRCLDH